MKKWCLIALGLISGCGNKDDEKRLDFKMLIGQKYYDSSQYTKAEEFMLTVKNEYPDYEEIDVLLANIYFAKAGFNYLDAVTKLINLQSKTDMTKVDASGMLSLFTKLLSISKADLDTLTVGGDKNSDNTFFTGLDVVYPAKPGDIKDADSVRSKVNTLKYLNKAIALLCPYVLADEAFTTKDDNSRYECTPATKKLNRKAQSTFLFSIAHLLEAVVFNSIILYDPDTFADSTTSLRLLAESSTTPATTSIAAGNLIKRANALNKTIATADMGDFATAVLQIKKDVDAILSTEAGGMLNQTVLNFSIAAEAIGKIPGMPKEVSNNITATMKQLQDASSKVTGAQASLSEQTDGFKDQINNKLVPMLKESIKKFNTEIDTGNLSTEEVAEFEANKTKICGAFSQIVADSTDPVEMPDGCTAQ